MPKNRSSRARIPLRARKSILVALAGPLLGLIGVLAVTFSSVPTATAATSNYLNFQARLLTAAGAVVPDGNYNVEFKIYSSSSSSGSSQGSCSGDAACQWVETRTSGNQVRVVNGYLTVNLGSVNAFSASMPWDQQLWLTMNIGGTGASPTWDGEMSPRIQLTAVPYAFRAGAAFQVQNSAGTTLLSTSGNQVTLPNATGSSSALTFGGDSTADLYRSASGTLKTDGNLTVAGNLTGSGTINLTGTGTSSIMGALGIGVTNPQGALTIANSAWLNAVDAAGTGNINILQVNSSNQIQLGAALAVDGGVVLPTNAGQVTFSDLPIDSSVSAGTKESYTMRVGSTNALTVYGEADGSGGVQNVRIAVGSSITPGYTLDVSGDVNTSGVYRVGGVQICSSTGCTPDATSNSFIQNQTGSSQNASFKISGSGTIGTNLTVSGTSTLTGNVGIGVSPGTTAALTISKGYGSSPTDQSNGISSSVSLQPAANFNGAYATTSLISVSPATGTTTSYVNGNLTQAFIGGGGGTVSSLIGIETRTGLTGAGATGTVGAGKSLYIDSIANQGSGSPSVTFNNQYGIYVNNQAAGSGSGGLTVQNAYGLYLAATSGATSSNYSIYSAGGANYLAGTLGVGGTVTLGSGTSSTISQWNTTNGNIAVNHGLIIDSSNDANNGIYFGSAVDTNLYRGGANLLKTDDSLQVVGSVTATSTIGFSNTGNANQGINLNMVVTSAANAGDVVVIDTSNAGQVTDSTTANSTQVFGIATTTNAGTGVAQPIVVSGVYQVNVTGTVNVGDYLVTSTTAGTAQATSTPTGGIIGQALSTASGGKVWALIRPSAGGGGTTNTTVNYNSYGLMESDWTTAGTMTTGALYGSSTVTVGNNVYMLGGRTGSSTYTSHIFSAPTSNPTSWSDTGVTLPVTLYNAQVAIIGSNIYLFGGYASGTTATRNVYYEPVSNLTSNTNGWSTATNALPSALTESQVAIIGSTVYLYGGYTGSAYTNAIYYASISNPLSWSTAAGTIPDANGLGDSALAVIGNYVYLFGGRDNSARTQEIYRAPVSAPTSVVDTGKALGAVADSGQLVIVGNYIYLMAVENNGGASSTVFRASINNPLSWSNPFSLPGPLVGSNAAIVGNAVYLFGGYDNSVYSNTIYSAPIYNGSPDVSSNPSWKVDSNYSSGGGSGTSSQTANNNTELAYAESATTATLSTSDQTVMTAPSITTDGNTPINIHFYAGTQINTVTMYVDLYDGSTKVGTIATVGENSGTLLDVVSTDTHLLPTAGSHTYSIHAHTSSGTAYLIGSSGTNMPMYIRVTLANPQIQGGSGIANGTTTQTANFNVQSSSANSVTAVIQGAASQSADILEVKNASNTNLLAVDASGNLTVKGNIGFANTGNANQALTVNEVVTSSVNAGDVVVIDTANAGQVTASTSANSTKVFGIATQTKSAGQSQPIVISGIYQVNVSGSVNVGDYLVTSSTTGQAQDTTSPSGGIVGQAMSTASAGQAWVLVKPASGAGGSSGSSNNYGLMESDFVDTGATLPATPGLVEGATATIGNYVYMFGGATATSTGTTTIMRAPVSNPTSWTAVGNLPAGANLYASQLAIIGSKIYLFGGAIAGTSTANIYSADVSDPVGSWTLAGSLSTSLTASSLAIIGSNIYLFGGYHNGTGYVNTIYTASVSNPLSWSSAGSVSPASSGIGDSNLAVIGNYVYLFGGTNGGTIIKNIYRAPISNPTSWVDSGGTIPNAGTGSGLDNSSLAIVGNYVYLFGGYNGGYLSTIFRAPVTDPVWGWSTSAYMNGVLVDSKASIVGSALYIWGGYNGTAYSNKIYSAPIANGSPDVSSNPSWITDSNYSSGGGSGTSGQTSNNSYQLDYKQITSNVSVSATSEGVANTIITGNSVTYSGAQVEIQFWAPFATNPANGAQFYYEVFRDGTPLGYAAWEYQYGSGGGNTPAAPLVLDVFDTPSAGAHTYSLKAWNTSNTTTVYAGNGGSGTILPAYLRVVLANPSLQGGSGIANGTTTQTANFNVQSSSASSVTAVIQGATSQSADILEVKDSSNTNLLAVDASGNLTVKGNIGFANTGNANQAFTISENITGSVTAGDVVVIDTANAGYVKDSSTANSTQVVGIATKTQTGGSEPIVISGIYQVNVGATSVNVGDYLVTSSTPGQATTSASPSGGVVGQAMSTASSNKAWALIKPAGGAGGSSGSSNNYGLMESDFTDTGATVAYVAHNQTATIGNTVYFFGGGDLSTFAATNKIYSAPVSNPTNVTYTGFNLPNNVRNGVIAVVGSNIYLYGGIDASGTGLTSIYTASVSNPTSWSSAGTLPGGLALNQSSLAIIGSNIYFFGGMNGASTYTNEIYRASIGSPATVVDTGHTVPVALRQSAIAVIGNYVYLFGGINSAGSTVNAIYRAAISNPETTWTTTTGSFPGSNAMSSANLAIVGNYVYLINGFFNSGYANFIWRAPLSNPVNGWADTGSVLPNGLTMGGIEIIGNALYLYGGIRVGGYSGSIYSAPIYNGSPDVSSNPSWITDSNYSSGGGSGTSSQTANNNYELAYATAPAGSNSVTATSGATSNTIVTAPSFTADGNTPVVVELFSPYWYSPAVNGGALFATIFDNGSLVNTAGVFVTEGTSPASYQSAGSVLRYRYTPAAGSHTLSFRAFESGGQAYVGSGTGTGADNVPAYIRVTLANPQIQGGSGIANGTTTQTANFNVQSSSASNVTAVIQGATSQSADILDVRNSSNTNLLAVDASGNLTVKGNIGFANTGNANQAITVNEVVTSAVTAGDVVVIDTANAGQVTDSTTANSTKVFGIATQTKSAGQSQPIVISGIYQVNVAGAVIVGDYLVTSATTGQAQDTTSPAGGIVGQAMSTDSSGKAWVLVKPASGAGGGGGTSPAFVYSSAAAVSNAHIVFTGSANSAPSYSAGTLTLPSNTTSVNVELWGGGGGGGGGGTNGSPTGGGAGNTSCFGTNSTACTSPSFYANGGGGGDHFGASPNVGGVGGAGGSGSGGDVNLTGSSGVGGNNSNPNNCCNTSSGNGGSAPLGGGGSTIPGPGGYSGNSGAAFGGGGAGGGSNSSGAGGGGGGGGGYTSKLMTSLLSSYYYTVGGAGSAGTGGTNGGNGGAGGTGGIKITVYTSGGGNGTQTVGTSTELAYTTFTGPITVSHSTDATADTVVTATPINVDGATPILINFYSPWVTNPTSQEYTQFDLYIDGSPSGQVTRQVYNNSGGGNQSGVPVNLEWRITPTAGTHTYAIKAFTGTPNTTVQGGGSYAPGFVRITLANPGLQGGAGIQNGTTLQTSANFNIMSASASSVTATIHGISGQSADILDVQNSSNINLLSVDPNGNTFVAGNLNVGGNIGFSNIGNANQAITVNEVVTSAVTAGDVVVIDITNAGQVTDSTTANSTKVFGIATQTQSAGVSQPIVISGIYQVNVTGTVNVGDYLVTSNTIGAAQDSTSPSGGVIGQAMSTASGGKAWVRVNPGNGAGGSGSGSGGYGLMESDWINTGASLAAGCGVGASQTATIGNTVYMFGGQNTSGTYTNTICSAPISNPTNWTNTGQTLPGNLGNSQLAIIGSTIYLFGGYNGSSATNVIYSAPVSSPTTWTNLSASGGPTLTSNLWASQLAIIGSSIYLFGGNTGGVAGTSTNQIYTASISNPTSWSASGTISPATGGLYLSQLAVIGNYVYLFGGNNSGGSNTTAIYRAPISNPLSWSSGGSIPAALDASAISIIGNYIYLFGGNNGSGYVSAIYRASINNPLTWTTLSNVSLPSAYGVSNLFIAGNAVYLAGGYDGSAFRGYVYSAPIYSGSPDVSSNPSWKVDSNASGGGSGTSSQTSSTNTELAYATLSSSVTIPFANNSDANSMVALSSGALTFDGNTTIRLEAYVPALQNGSNGYQPLAYGAMDNTSSLFPLGNTGVGTNSTVVFGRWYGSTELTPSAGSHTFYIRAEMNSGSANTNGALVADSGSPGNSYGKAWIRISKINPSIQGGSGINNGTTTQTGNFNIQSSAANNVTAVIQGATSQSADILDVRDSSSNNLLAVDASGNLSVKGNIGFTNTGNSSQVLTLNEMVTTSVNANDVVVIDTNNAGQVTTTTLANSTKVFGVATQTKTAGQSQPIAISGIYQVNVDTAAVNVGDYLVTSGTSGRATDSTSPSGGVIGQAMSAKSAGSNGTVWVRLNPGNGAGGSGSSANYELMESDFTQTGTIAAPVSDSQVVTVGNNIYMLGGNNNGTITNHIYTATVANPNSWTDTGNTLPQAIAGSVSAIIGSNIYIFGGINTSGSPVSTAWWAPLSGIANTASWNTVSSTLPTVDGQAQLAIIGSKVYIFGGYTGSVSNVIYSASLSNPLSWSANAGSTLPGPLRFSQTAVIGNYVYLFGGDNGTAPTNVIYRAPVSNPLSWSNTGVTLNAAQYVSQLAIVGNYVYLFGGQNSSGAQTAVVQRAPVNNPVSGWVSAFNLPVTLTQSNIQIVGNALYLFGGSSGGFTNAIYSAPIVNGSPDISGNPSWKVDMNVASGGAGTSSQTANNNFQLDYAQITSNVSLPLSSTTTIVTGNSVTYDGSTPVEIQFFTPAIDLPAQSQTTVNEILYEDGSALMTLQHCFIWVSSGTSADNCNGMASTILTPSAGAHTFAIKAQTTFASTLEAGTGTGGAAAPAYLRIIRANPPIQGGSGINNSTTTQTGNINIQSSSASNPTMVLQGATSQSADILDVKNSGGSILFSVGPTGNVAIAGNLTVSGSVITNGSAMTGTTLPASPVNGQEFYLLADGSRPVYWHLWYNSSLRSGAGAWAVLGATPLTYNWSSGASTTSTSYTDLSGAPSITLGSFSGSFLFSYSCGTTTSSSGTRDYVGLNVGGTIVSEVNAEPQGGTNNANHLYPYNQVVATETSGQTAKLQFYTQSGTAYFGNCTLNETPYYVY